MARPAGGLAQRFAPSKLHYQLDAGLPPYTTGMQEGWPAIPVPTQVDVVVRDGELLFWVWGEGFLLELEQVVPVDTSVDQPGWLVDLMADARLRLGE